MSMVNGVFGIVAASLVGVIIYYQWCILRHFTDHEEVSMKGFFTDERALTAFNVITVSAFVYAMTLFVSVSTTFFAAPQLVTISQAGTLLVLAGFTYFFYRIAVITRQDED